MRARTATFFSAVALALMATIGTGTAMADGPCADTDVAPGAVATAVVQQATLCLLNQQRQAAGEVPLVAQSDLETAATSYSSLMVAQGFFDHVSPSGSTLTARIAGVGYTHAYGSWDLGENLAWGSGALATPGAIVDAWMRSPGHRANILDGTFREIGIGIVTGTPVPQPAPGATYTTEFGVRSGAQKATASGARNSGAGTGSEIVAPPGTSGAAAKHSSLNASKKHKARKARRARKAHKGARHERSVSTQH